jgi:hypothetical protein
VFFFFLSLGEETNKVGESSMYIFLSYSTLFVIISFKKPLCAFVRQTNNSSAVYRHAFVTVLAKLKYR